MLPRLSGFSRLASLFAILILAGLALTSPAVAAWISTGGAEGSRVEVRLLNSDAERMVIEVSVPGFDATPLTIDGRTYYQLSLPGEGNLLEAGAPELPHVCRSLIIPDQAGTSVTVLAEESVEFPQMAVVPSKGNLLRTIDPATVPFTFGPAYDRAAVFPEAEARLGEPYILRDYRGISVEALPFRTNGNGTLRVATRMTLEVAAAGVDLRNSISRQGPPDRVVQDFIEIYRHRFVNYETGRYAPIGEQGTMLVICADEFAAQMAPFVEWKLQSGIPTTLVNISTIGNNSTAIKNYITAQYTPAGLAYVLLVGDAAQIATPTAAGGSSDPTYACVVGTDRYPELFVGRFSAETAAHVQTQVQRSVEYEKNPQVGFDWYVKGTGVASNQGPGDDGEYDYQHVNVIRTKLLAYGYTLVDQIYDPSGTAAMVATALNDGRSIVNYTGHGSTTSWSTTGFSNSNVAALQNDWKLPFIFSVACVNGQFSGYTCFAEAWLRSTRTGTGNPIGAIGTYMSSVNQSWNPPMCAQDECDDLLVNGEMFTYGGLCYNGSCQMMDEYGATDGGDMFMTWHIFGDPSLLVRSKLPAAMTVQHDGALLLGLNQYAVNVPGVAGARCALFAGGVLYGVGYTDAGGQAQIALNPAPPEPMTLTLTVVAPNRVPYQGPVEVSPPSGPFVVYDNFTASDPQGDGDGQCDAGEPIELTVALKNVGVATATGVSAVLTEDDPYVEIVTDTQAFGNIDPGRTALCEAPYVVQLAADAPDNHAVTLQLAVSAAEGSWNRTFSLTIGAPVLAYASHVASDNPPYGNGSGWLSAGEQFALTVTAANSGHANAANAVVSVVDAGAYLEVVSGTGSCADVPAGGQASFSPVVLRVLESCPVPTSLGVSLAMQVGSCTPVPFQLQVSVGGFADDCEVNRGWTCGVSGDNATSGTWVLADPNGTIATNGQVGQPEDDHTPVPGAVCYVTGNSAPGASASDADVDGGRTTLESPVFNLSNAAGATVHYWFWYANNQGNNPGADYWYVQVSNDGTTWVNIEQTTASTNAWTERTYNLQDYVTLSSTMKMRFVAEDLSPGSLVEALVDDFTLTILESLEDAPIAPAITRLSLEQPVPNPFSRSAEIRFAVPQTSPVRVAVFDVAGRCVRRLVDGEVAAGPHTLSWDRTNDAGLRVGSGVYYVRMSAAGFQDVKSVTLVE